jgi:hypothetical protein
MSWYNVQSLSVKLKGFFNDPVPSWNKLTLKLTYMKSRETKRPVRLVLLRSCL